MVGLTLGHWLVNQVSHICCSLIGAVPNGYSEPSEEGNSVPRMLPYSNSQRETLVNGSRFHAPSQEVAHIRTNCTKQPCLQAPGRFKCVPSVALRRSATKALSVFRLPLSDGNIGLLDRQGANENESCGYSISCSVPRGLRNFSAATPCGIDYLRH